jgi:hypothetical protein
VGEQRHFSPERNANYGSNLMMEYEKASLVSEGWEWCGREGEGEWMKGFLITTEEIQ